MNKILVILGSPRKQGNSATLAQNVVAGAEAEGADVESFYLHEMDIKPCNACDVCIKQPEKGCILKDDMHEIYTSLPSADSIVIATPIYWFNMSAQTKLFIDRLYGLVVPKRQALTGKKIGIILTYGDTNEHSSGAINAINSFKDIFRYIGAEITGIVHGSAMEAGEIKHNQNIMKNAYELGMKLRSGN